MGLPHHALEQEVLNAENLLIASEFSEAAKAAEGVLLRLHAGAAPVDLRTRAWFVLVQAHYMQKDLQPLHHVLLQHRLPIRVLPPRAVLLWALVHLELGHTARARDDLHHWLIHAMLAPSASTPTSTPTSGSGSTAADATSAAGAAGPAAPIHEHPSTTTAGPGGLPGMQPADAPVHPGRPAAAEAGGGSGGGVWRALTAEVHASSSGTPAGAASSHADITGAGGSIAAAMAAAVAAGSSHPASSTDPAAAGAPPTGGRRSSLDSGIARLLPGNSPGGQPARGLHSEGQPDGRGSGAATPDAWELSADDALALGRLFAVEIMGKARAEFSLARRWLQSEAEVLSVSQVQLLLQELEAAELVRIQEEQLLTQHAVQLLEGELDSPLGEPGPPFLNPQLRSRRRPGNGNDTSALVTLTGEVEESHGGADWPPTPQQSSSSSGRRVQFQQQLPTASPHASWQPSLASTVSRLLSRGSAWAQVLWRLLQRHLGRVLSPHLLLVALSALLFGLALHRERVSLRQAAGLAWQQARSALLEMLAMAFAMHTNPIATTAAHLGSR